MNSVHDPSPPAMDDAALDALIADEEAAYMQMEEDECMQFMQPAAAAPFLPVAEFEDTLLPAPPPPASLSPQACPVAPVVCTPPPRTAQPLAGTPAPKPVAPRRRFKQKQPDLDGAYGVAAQPLPRVHTSEIWNDVDLEKFVETDHRGKYFCVFNKFRHYLHKSSSGQRANGAGAWVSGAIANWAAIQNLDKGSEGSHPSILARALSTARCDSIVLSRHVE